MNDLIVTISNLIKTAYELLKKNTETIICNCSMTTFIFNFKFRSQSRFRTVLFYNKKEKTPPEIFRKLFMYRSAK